MVKADPQRDYYADLKVPSNADASEIRKAFLKLALLHHPDRNPGRENEVVTQFQAIQAAHEILSDPVQRSKYDNDRKRYAYRNSSSAYNQQSARPTPGRYPTNPTPSASYYSKPGPSPRQPRPPPPQQNSTYTNGADRFKDFKPPPTAQKPKAGQNEAHERANVFTAWQKMKTPKGDGTQKDNGNASFGRSKSTRVPSKNGFDPSAPGPTNEPAAPRSSYRSAYQRPAPTPPSPSQTPDPSRPSSPSPKTDRYKPPTDPYKSSKTDGYRPAYARVDSDHIPFSEGMPRVRTPYPSTKGERTSMFAEGLGRSASMRNSPTSRPGSSAQGGFASDTGKNGQRKSYGGNATRPFSRYDSSQSESSSVEEIPKASFKARTNGSSAKKSPDQPKQPSGFKPPPTNGFTGNAAQATPNVFKSRSAESINMKFSPNEWKGKFEGTPDYFAPNMSKGTTGKSRMSPSRGRSTNRSATNQPSNSRTQPPPPPPPVFSMPPPPPPLNTKPDARPASASAPQSAKFAPEEWQQTFKEATWAMPVPETSPRRAPVPTKRPKAVPRKDNSDVSPNKPKYQAFAEDAANSDGDAMDVDTDYFPPPDPKPSSTKPPPTHKSVPSMGSEGGIPIPTGPAASSAYIASTPLFDAFTGGLKNTEPFLPRTNGEGLGGMGDVASSLPFKSGASNTHPTKLMVPEKHKYPDYPKAPAPPPTLNLDKPTREQYLRDMATYFGFFRKWNKEMLKQFDAREDQLERKLDRNWLTNVGEKTTTMGFDSYMKTVEEDERARAHWQLGCEKHKNTMLAFKEFRLKTTREHARVRGSV
ncbi:hypothetical protein GQ43DRAFT_153254 [Delitschia confertaspora ATCC 74209]|uniref:J domain-containing protein n=1 Tax=Delitschia confertaspora ATCC 74209 TaxID=1513339 RepID=A0A9P4JSJ1_9PLEO|nr:hypothetical protein GQ43DRAFT_153254 [Delitschia confertaspora ATCC 74209]